MYTLLLIMLLLAYLFYNKRFKDSRQYQLTKQFPSLGLEIPVIGSSWKLYGNPEELMSAISRLLRDVTRLGGAARIYIFTYYYIVITDAYDASAALKICLQKDDIYRFLTTFSGNGTAFISGALAKEHRAVLMKSFHPRILHDFVDDFWEESVRFADSLAPHAGAGPFSLIQYLYKFITRAALKAGLDKIDGREHDSDEFLEAIMSWEETAANRLMSLWKHPDLLYKFCSDCEKTKHIIKILHKYSQKIIDQRTKELNKYQTTTEEQKSETMKSWKVRYFDSVINSHLNDEEKIEEILILLIATDLTSMTLGFSLMLLGQYPGVQERVYTEVRDVFGDSDRPVTKEDLGRLDYLDMVIKETLRLYPPAPIIARKVNKDFTLPSGKTIPAGCGVFVGICGVHRNPKYWGDDADSFDPERFSPERFKNVPPQAYIPFSFGPRNCIGYKYGLILLKIAISTILRKYKIVGKPAEGPEPNIRTVMRLFIKAQNDFQIELIKIN